MPCVMLTIRVPGALVEKADSLTGPGWNRSDVLRDALVAGLATLQRRARKAERKQAAGEPGPNLEG